MSGRMLLARRTLIASAAGALAFAPWMGRARAQIAPVASDQTADALFRELDERIEAAMVRYHVPGVAVGVFWQGREHWPSARMSRQKPMTGPKASSSPRSGASVSRIRIRASWRI
jgi:CubicO group peptidase (beta-lactamase class C family)